MEPVIEKMPEIGVTGDGKTVGDQAYYSAWSQVRAGMDTPSVSNITP